MTGRTETLPPDDCSACDACREPMDSWLEDEEPITITRSIEALHSTQDKTADAMRRLCVSLEAQTEKT